MFALKRQQEDQCGYRGVSKEESNRRCRRNNEGRGKGTLCGAIVRTLTITPRKL